MTELDLIADNIKNKNLDKALELCKLNINSKNKEIIYNFLGVINFIKKDLHQAEKYFLDSLIVDETFQDPIRNLCVIYANNKSYER